MGIKRRWNGFGDWLLQLRNGDGAENGEVMVSLRLVDARGGVALVPSGERGKSQERQGRFLIGHTMPTLARKEKKKTEGLLLIARLLVGTIDFHLALSSYQDGVPTELGGWVVQRAAGASRRDGGVGEGQQLQGKRGRKNSKGGVGGYSLSAVSEPGND